MSVTLQFLGAASTVTGSKYLLTVNGRRILIDAGQFQGQKELRLLNWEPFPIDPATITDILLTHAHADHTTYLPALVKQGFSGPIWATPGTIALAEIVLRDAGKLQELSTEDALAGGYSKHNPPLPLYDSTDVQATLPLLRAVEWDTDTDIDGITARWVRAGHILGSASILVQADEVSVLFGGDVGRHDHPILKPRATPPGADYVLVESTYGDREHPEPDLPHETFASAIRDTVARGGIVIIPAFAIDRTEAVLKTMVDLYRDGRIPDVPTYVDGPMALAALDVYRDTTLDELRDDITVDDFLGLPRLREVRSSSESKQLNRIRKPAVIISSSGMAEGGRVLHHLKRRLPDSRNTVILVGYQAEGTRGRAMESGAKQVKINGEYVKVNAQIVRDTEFSVHGDASDMIDWLAELDPAPKQAFVVHGELEAARIFAERVERELGLDAIVPAMGEIVALSGRGEAEVLDEGEYVGFDEEEPKQD